MGVAPASLSGSRVTRDRTFGNIATMFAVPFLELTFPASGLPPGVDMQQLPAQCQELLASHCFWMQCQFRLDVKPGMEPTALDNSMWPDGLDCSEHTLLAITDNVDWRRNERQQLSPVFVTLIRHPVPTNNVANRPGNETNTTTNPDAVNNYCMVNLTGQNGLGETGGIPAPGCLATEGSSRPWLPGTASKLSLGLLTQQPGSVVFGYFADS